MEEQLEGGITDKTCKNRHDGESPKISYSYPPHKVDCFLLLSSTQFPNVGLGDLHQTTSGHTD